MLRHSLGRGVIFSLQHFIGPALNLMPCLPSCLELTACLPSRLRREAKKAVISLQVLLENFQVGRKYHMQSLKNMLLTQFWGIFQVETLFQKLWPLLQWAKLALRSTKYFVAKFSSLICHKLCCSFTTELLQMLYKNNWTSYKIEKFENLFGGFFYVTAFGCCAQLKAG